MLPAPKCIRHAQRRTSCASRNRFRGLCAVGCTRDLLQTHFAVVGALAVWQGNPKVASLLPTHPLFFMAITKNDWLFRHLVARHRSVPESVERRDGTRTFLTAELAGGTPPAPEIQHTRKGQTNKEKDRLTCVKNLL